MPVPEAPRSLDEIVGSVERAGWTEAERLMPGMTKSAERFANAPVLDAIGRLLVAVQMYKMAEAGHGGRLYPQPDAVLSHDLGAEGISETPHGSS